MIKIKIYYWENQQFSTDYELYVTRPEGKNIKYQFIFISLKTDFFQTDQTEQLGFSVAKTSKLPRGSNRFG